ncbi:MAG TPA: response regulator [Verrucomicrobiae bacterium]|nr:response regulator [Verrucomicrobiae bacterium]
MASVLYVEDEENDVFFMRRSFDRAGLEGTLQVVLDGQAAIDYLAGNGPFANRQEHPLPEVVLLDLNLPMISGFQVLNWIRNQPQLRDLPVVVFSSSARPEDQKLAQELGADDYFEKPGSGFDFGRVVKALSSKWLGRVSPAPACRTIPARS